MAPVAESVDAVDSKSTTFGVGVRVSLGAPFFPPIFLDNSGL